MYITLLKQWKPRELLAVVGSLGAGTLYIALSWEWFENYTDESAM